MVIETILIISHPHFDFSGVSNTPKNQMQRGIEKNQ